MPGRYPLYEVREDPEGRFYIIGDGGHLAHVPAGDGTGGMRAAFFDTRDEADRVVREITGTAT
jgi:hypothetical protein